jgi:hypothetical protein
MDEHQLFTLKHQNACHYVKTIPHNQGYFCNGMLFQKFFLRRTQAGTMFRNLHFLASV